MYLEKVGRNHMCNREGCENKLLRGNMRGVVVTPAYAGERVDRVCLGCYIMFLERRINEYGLLLEEAKTRLKHETHCLYENKI